MTPIEDVTIVGDGSQTAFGNIVSRDLILKQLNFVRGHPSMVLSEGEISDRVAGYVAAANHDEIVGALRRSQIAALSGPVGAGVTTTAIAALRQLRPGLQIRRFSTGEDDVEEIRATEPCGYLVRAGDEEASRLRSCLEAVRASAGFLLVVGAAAELRRFREFLRAIPVQPPPAEVVYRRRLMRCGITDVEWLDWPQASELLKDALPGDARRLANLVADAVRQHGDAREVEQAYRGWDEQLRGWFAEHLHHRDRTLMVAAATITPADETSVYGAALSLARQLGVDVAGGGLAWCPSTGLSQLLDADRVDSGIVFRRQGFANSVLRHVWEDYPLARLDLLAWLASLPTDEVIALEAEFQYKIASVFADLAAEHGAVEKIVQAAAQWAGGSRNSADLAYVALARTCLHPFVGGRVRHRLYEWSRQRNAPQTLKLTIVRVCQVLGETHLSIALTRLKHLATYGDDQIQDEVFLVVRALAEDHPRAVLEAVLQWCRSAGSLPGRDASRRIRVGLRLLLSLLGLGQVAGDPGDGECVTAPIVPTVSPASSLRVVVGLFGQLAKRDDARVRSELLAAAGALAVEHRAEVVRASLTWAANADVRPLREAMPLAITGTELFLRLAAERDADGTPLIFTGVAAVSPEACLPAWRMALTAEVAPGMGYGPKTGYVNFYDVLHLWLETASSDLRMREGIVTVLSQAAGHDPTCRRELLGAVHGWARLHPERRHVKEDFSVRLCRPEWKRLLLLLGVRSYRAFANGR